MLSLKNRLFAILILALFVFASNGCQVLSKFQTQAADKVAKGVAEYCKNTDAEFREKFRADVNAQAAPHSVQVECAPGDVGD